MKMRYFKDISERGDTNPNIWAIRADGKEKLVRCGLEDPYWNQFKVWLEPGMARLLNNAFFEEITQKEAFELCL